MSGTRSRVFNTAENYSEKLFIIIVTDYGSEISLNDPCSNAVKYLIYANFWLHVRWIINAPWCSRSDCELVLFELGFSEL